MDHQDELGPTSQDEQCSTKTPGEGSIRDDRAGTCKLKNFITALIQRLSGSSRDRRKASRCHRPKRRCTSDMTQDARRTLIAKSTESSRIYASTSTILALATRGRAHPFYTGQPDVSHDQATFETRLNTCVKSLVHIWLRCVKVADLSRPYLPNRDEAVHLSSQYTRILSLALKNISLARKLCYLTQ